MDDELFQILYEKTATSVRSSSTAPKRNDIYIQYDKTRRERRRNLDL
jgi:hypothetical protein